MKEEKDKHIKILAKAKKTDGPAPAWKPPEPCPPGTILQCSTRCEVHCQTAKQ